MQTGGCGRGPDTSDRYTEPLVIKRKVELNQVGTFYR